MLSSSVASATSCSHQSWMGVPVAPYANHPLVVSTGVLDVGHCDRYVVGAHCQTRRHFLPKSSWRRAFPIPVSHLCTFFAEVSVKVFGPFFFGIRLFVFLLLSLRVLCVFWMTVWWRGFCKHFRAVCDLSSPPLDIVFHKSQVSRLMKASLPLNSPIDNAVVLYLKNPSRSQGFSSLLLSRRFVVLWFIMETMALS